MWLGTDAAITYLAQALWRQGWHLRPVLWFVGLWGRPPWCGASQSPGSGKAMCFGTLGFHVSLSHHLHCSVLLPCAPFSVWCATRCMAVAKALDHWLSLTRDRPAAHLPTSAGKELMSQTSLSTNGHGKLAGKRPA